MTRIVVVSGNPRPASRTSTLAAAVGEALAPGTGPALIEVGAQRADLASAQDLTAAYVQEFRSRITAG